MQTFKKLPKIKPNSRNPAPNIQSGYTLYSRLADIKGLYESTRPGGSYERGTGTLSFLLRTQAARRMLVLTMLPGKTPTSVGTGGNSLIQLNLARLMQR